MGLNSGSGEDSATDINMDNLLGTGVGSNREPITPEVDENGKPVILNTGNGDEGNGNTSNGNEGDEGDGGNESNNENQDNLRSLFGSFVNEEGLDDSNKEIRKGLLDQYKGEGFDESGNILDKEGNIVANFDDLYTEYTSEDNLTLDASGNQINDKGEIVKTAVDIAIDTTVVNKLHSESEYEFLNEDGSTKIYSDDDAGINEFTKDVSAQRFEEYKGEFFGQHPVLTEVAKHLLSGGDLDTFNQGTDYTKLDVSTMSKEEKIKHIRHSYQVAGLDKTRVDGLIQLFTDANLIDAEVAKAIPALEANEASTKAARDIAYQKSVEEKQKKVNTYWNEIQTVVTKGDLGAIKVPESEKVDFFKYLSNAVDDKGNSKEFLDRTKETKEQGLMLSYLRYKGFDLSKLVNAKATSQRVLSLKERIKASAKLKPNTVNESRQRASASGEDITIDNMLG